MGTNIEEEEQLYTFGVEDLHLTKKEKMFCLKIMGFHRFSLSKFSFYECIHSCLTFCVIKQNFL